MRSMIEKERGGWLWRCWSNDYRNGEIAYAFFGLRGPRLEIEFPSDWHEQRRAWVRIGLGLLQVCFSFPWKRTVPDQGQCSGPTYGFYFFQNSLVLSYGKTKGTRGDPRMHIDLPWALHFHKRWELVEGDSYAKGRQCWVEVPKPLNHGRLATKWTAPYRYVRRSGEVQERTATYYAERWEHRYNWLRWFPFPRRIRTSISGEFSDEVGEGTGSWKGGTTGCGYDIRGGETPFDCLQRMERERVFR